MKKYYLLFLLALNCSFIFAQINVTVNVTDDFTSSPISGVDVTADGITLTTDLNGDATFSLASNNNYSYTTLGECYLNASGTLTVATSDFTESVAMTAITETDATVFFFLSAPGEPAIFSPVDVTLTGINGNTNNYNFTYDFGSFQESISGVAYGDYTITYEGECRATSTSSVTVSCDAYNNPNPGVIEQFDTIGALIVINTNVTQNMEVLTADENGPDITYQWIDCNNGNAPISGETNQSFTATVNGNYAVIISNANCPVSETSACVNVDTLSLESNTSPLDAKLFPNPVVNNLTIKFGNHYENIQVTIFSLLGQLVKTVEIKNSMEVEFNMSNLPSGSYLVQMNADGNTKSTIILKK